MRRPFFWLFVDRKLRDYYGPGPIVVAGLLAGVFLAGMAYVTVRQSAAQGTVTALVEGTNSQGREATIEGTIIREPNVREGRAAYIVRVHAVNGSMANFGTQ